MNRSSIWIALGIGVAVLMHVALGRDPVARRSATAHSAVVRPNKHARAELTVGSVRMTTSQSELDEEVARKYAVLFVALAPDARESLHRILVARESPVQDDAAEAAQWERRLSILLRQDEYALYEQLRESTREQAQLQAFARKVLETAPLTPHQQHELLRAKLRHKQQRETLELQVDTPRPDLSIMEDGYARDVALQGVKHYAREFLDETRTVLSEEQWLALEQFEMSALEQMDRLAHDAQRRSDR
jgi:hypothetical protein